MGRKRKIIAAICALALAVNIFGAYTDSAGAASLPVTSDDAVISQEIMERGTAKSNDDSKTEMQQLLPGKKVQRRLVSGDDGQQYQITLKNSGQLTIRFEGDTAKLSGCLTDQNGMSWAPRRAVGEKYTYQLKKGTYYYQVQMVKGTKMPGAGLEYAITAIVKSAKAKFENNITQKKAAKLPLGKSFYGHLAQNAPEEYYKVTLDRVSNLTFTVDPQIADKTPETFVVTLYNKDGKRMSKWENPDWVAYYEAWLEDEDLQLEDWPALNEILPAGEYYIGVSVKKNRKGQVPASARYGQYKIQADVSGLGITLELSHDQAEYTGKMIDLPKVSIKEYPQDEYYSPDIEKEEWIELFTDRVWDLSKNYYRYKAPGVKKIGRYRIGDYDGKVGYRVDGSEVYAIFTVTPIRGKINGVSSKKKGQVQISVKKNAQSTGYQIQIARDKKFKKSKRTLNMTNLKKTIKGLSSGKKYYVRVRNYKDVKTYYCSEIAVPESIYGKWSGIKTIVCK